jgi:hypothetical protein
MTIIMTNEVHTSKSKSKSRDVGLFAATDITPTYPTLCRHIIGFTEFCLKYSTIFLLWQGWSKTAFLDQLVLEPTRITETQSTTLDLFFSKQQYFSQPGTSNPRYIRS